MRVAVIMLAWITVAASASAQDHARAAVTPSDSFWSWPPDDAVSLRSLCETAAQTEWAAAVAAGSELTCSVERHVSPRFAIVHVRHPTGELLVLAVEHGAALRVVAGLTEVRDLRDVVEGTTTSSAAVTRVAHETVGGWPFVTFEVHGEGAEGGVATARDDLVVCLHRPGRLDTMICVERAPLRATRNGARASATAGLDTVGQLHVALVDGTWEQLYDDHVSVAFSDTPTLLPIPSRLPDVNVEGDDPALPVLYVDQWRHDGRATAPELTHVWADAAPDDGSHEPSDHEPERSLEALCAHAARWLEEPIEGAMCHLHPTDVEGMFVVEVGSWMSADAFVAVGDASRLRVVARIGRLWTGPTRSGGTDLLRVHRRTLPGREVLLLETETTLIDHDLGVLEAYGFAARHATACEHDGDVRTLRCGARVPLSYEPFTQTMREVVVPSSFPFAWREHHGNASRAVVAVRPDGALRLTLRAGSWEDLAGGSEHNPLPVATPIGAERQVIVPMF